MPDCPSAFEQCLFSAECSFLWFLLEIVTYLHGKKNNNLSCKIIKGARNPPPAWRSHSCWPSPCSGPSPLEEPGVMHRLLQGTSHGGKKVQEPQSKDLGEAGEGDALKNGLMLPTREPGCGSLDGGGGKSCWVKKDNFWGTSDVF